MSKVITFGRYFHKEHPRAGEPTFFVEKIWESIGLPGKEYSFALPDEYCNFLRKSNSEIWEKHHTIRAGHRWKVDDKFSPRVWSGKPRRSKQIIIAPDITILKIWDFKIKKSGDYVLYDKILSLKELEMVAKNDGLTCDDFECWFNSKEFDGQIICWSQNVNYD